MAEDNNNEKVLYILRGLPGSGKSSLAKSILKNHKGNGVVLSTDDYFMVNGKYEYDSTKIGEAHKSNQENCRKKCQEGISPIIIDNTNVKRWEAKVYVEMALEHGYKIEVREPDTPWWKSRDAEQLAKKTLHGVPVKKIKGMLAHWDEDFSVESILKEEPPNRDNHHSRNFNNADGNYSKFNNHNNFRGGNMNNYRGNSNGRGNFQGNNSRGRGNGNNFRGNNFRGNNFRGNNFRGNSFRGNNIRGNNFRGNNYRGNNYRGNNFRGNNRGSYNSSGDYHKNTEFNNDNNANAENTQVENTNSN